MFPFLIASQFLVGALIVRQGEAPFAATEQLAGLGSWEYDVTSGKMTWSEQCYRLLGFNPEATLATKELLFETVHLEERERFLEDFNEAIARSASASA